PIILHFFIFMLRPPPRPTLFPTRRSSDLQRRRLIRQDQPLVRQRHVVHPELPAPLDRVPRRLRQPVPPKAVEAEHPVVPVVAERDRKSTRLNSSHVAISYAVFCWKKKNQH